MGKPIRTPATVSSANTDEEAGTKSPPYQKKKTRLVQREVVVSEQRRNLPTGRNASCPGQGVSNVHEGASTRNCAWPTGDVVAWVRRRHPKRKTIRSAWGSRSSIQGRKKAALEPQRLDGRPRLPGRGKGASAGRGHAEQKEPARDN